MASSIILSDLYPSAFVHENTASMVYYALNMKQEDPNYKENFLMINVGGLGTKMSLIEVKNTLDKPDKKEGPFHPEVTSKVDKFYPAFSGHNLDYCFSNIVLNNHHKHEEHQHLLDDYDKVSFHKLLFQSLKAKEILSVN